MNCPFSLENVKFRETAHITFEDEYVTAYQSTDIVPNDIQERQHASEMEEVFSIKQDGMTRQERRAYQRMLAKQSKRKH